MSNDPADYLSGTELRVCQLIAERQMQGVLKYGTTVRENPLPIRAWLRHALEETLDNAIYLQRAIEELDARESEAQIRETALKRLGKSGLVEFKPTNYQVES
jgi:hypothetical protein